MAQNLIFQLLKHPFLDDAWDCDNCHDDDLKFIVESLIEYYSQRHSLCLTLSRNTGNKINSARGMNGVFLKRLTLMLMLMLMLMQMLMLIDGLTLSHSWVMWNH